MSTNFPVGLSSFKNLVEENYYFADQTLFIQEVMEAEQPVILLPRPRRFGKSLMLSMLKSFVEKEVGQTSEDSSAQTALFAPFAIGQTAHMQHIGKHPVVFLNFKNVKRLNWKTTYRKLAKLIQDEYTLHNYLAESDKLSDKQKAYFTAVRDLTAPIEDMESSLKNLVSFLYAHHGSKVYVLIDDYDKPLYAHFPSIFYSEIIEFLDKFVGQGLTGHLGLEKAVITCLAGLSAPAIFTSLQSEMRQYGIADKPFSTSFGFTQEVVEDLVTKAQFPISTDEINKWYGNYNYGEHRLYNPWSVLTFLRNEQADFQQYSTNSSLNAIVQKLIVKSSTLFKHNLKLLLKGGELTIKPDTHMAFSRLNEKDDAIWTFLLRSGYLSAVSTSIENKQTFITVKVPNQEIQKIFFDILDKWMNESMGTQQLQKLYDAFIEQSEDFENILKEFTLSVLTYYDKGADSEQIFHALVLGFFSKYHDSYDVASRKMGEKNFHALVIPSNKEEACLLLVVYSVSTGDVSLDDAGTEAIKRFKARNYPALLQKQGLSKLKNCIVVTNKNLELKVFFV